MYEEIKSKNKIEVNLAFTANEVIIKKIEINKKLSHLI